MNESLNHPTEGARLRAILDDMTEAVCRFRPDGTILFVNQPYCRMFGRSREELEGSTYVPVIHPDDLARVQAELRAMGPELPWVVIENRVVTAAGEVRWTQWTNHGFFDEAGNLLECQSAGRDITERVEAELALRRSHNELRFLAEASELLASSLDTERTLAAVARSAVPFLADGCTVYLIEPGETDTQRRLAFAHVDPEVERAMGTPGNRLPVDQLPDSLRRLFQRVKDGESVILPTLSEADPEAFELPDDLPGLARLESRCSYMLVPMAARGEMLGSMGFTCSRRHSGRHYEAGDLALATELGRRAAMAIDNARLYARLQEMDRRKDDFMAVLGHELRNPLAAITTALDLMAAAEEPEARLRALAIARRQAENQARLVDDLLDVSRFLRGSIDLEVETVDLRERLAELVEVHRQAAEEGPAIELELPPAAVWAAVDPTRFEQIVGNLLDNARKYSPPDQPVRCTLERRDGRARIRVRDRGVGLAPESLERIFEPFVQVGERDGSPASGLGLGLTIVRELVELHGGSVSASSAGPGRGSELTLELPIVEGAVVAAPGAVGTAGDEEPARALRILVTDDNPDAADVLAELLSLWGHEVRVAYGGEVAVATATDFCPDVAIVDLGMPGIDGFDTARLLRGLPAGGPKRLIALTGYAQPADVERALAAGFDEHLAKPVRAEVLRQVLAG